MSCLVDIGDVVKEMAKKPVPIIGLPANQVAGVLAGVVAYVDQPANVISTEKGVGLYGLSLSDLQLTGAIKCGFSYSADIVTALEDPSVFTGKYSVTTIDGLLVDETTQMQIMNDVIAKKTTDLVNMGVLTGDETDQEIATLAGQTSKFSVFDVLANTLGNISDAFGAAMDALGILAAAGALIAVIKNADILGKLKGFGTSIASLPDLAFGTVDTSDTDAGVDDIVGSARVPSLADAGSLAASAESSVVDTATGAVSSVTGGLPKTSINPEDYV